MIDVLTWRWGSKYSNDHVFKLKAGVARNLSVPHRFWVVTDQPPPAFCLHIGIDRPDLLKVSDGCYARLAMFNPFWRAERGLGDILCLDLDMVITGSLDQIVARPEPFVILGRSHFNPCPVNGSVMLIRDGAPAQVWERFNAEEAERVARADGTHRGTDQTWIAHTAPDCATFGPADGVYAYRKPGWGSGDVLPAGARIVAFPGAADPAKLGHLPWVAQHWRT